MLARINSGKNPGTPIFINEKQFDSENIELKYWAVHVGRHGSHYTTTNYVYIKVKDENDNPFQYYSSPEEIKREPVSTLWGLDSGGAVVPGEMMDVLLGVAAEITKRLVVAAAVSRKTTIIFYDLKYLK